MAKILYLSRSIYPRTGGSAFVSENLAKHFDPEKFIVVGEKDIFFNKKEKLRDYPFPTVTYIRSAISLKNRGERFLAPLKLIAFPIALMRLLYICKRNNVESALIVYPDGFYMYLGYFLQLFTKNQFSLYFHNTYFENRRGINKAMASWVQNRLFKRANKIYLISEGLQGLYIHNYPFFKEKMQVLPHAFTDEINAFSRNTVRKKNEIKSFTFTGNFNESNMDATKRMVTALKNIPDVQINFCTPVPKLLLEARGLDVSVINYRGYLDEKKYRALLDESDFVVLTHGFKGGYSEEEYQTIFPTRTLPLLNAKSPMIVHCPENCFLSTFIRPYNCCHLIFSDNVHQVEEEIRKIIEDNDEITTRMINKNECLSYFDGKKSAAMLLKDLSDERA